MFVFSLMFCFAVIMGSTTILSQDTLPVRWDYSDLYVSYPAEARDHQLEGTVVVWVRVDERGNVKSWRIVNLNE
ncbi:MAG: energy transducer TonB [Ignavibacteria bacterium]|nr:energy transducer TonB [Ignavibacteria bacterium]